MLSSESAPVPLHFEASDVRMIIRAGEPWWVLKDICSAIGLANPHDAASRLFTWQKDRVGVSDSIGRTRQTPVVNEAGVYGLVMGSNKPVAEHFSKWLFTEVLPSIRQHGCYPPPSPIDLEALPEPQPLQAPHWSTNAQRFLEEADRIAAEHEMSADRLLSPIMSKQAVTRLRNYGEGLRGLLKDEARCEAIIGAGFDLKYILFGTRTLTREERVLISSLRDLDRVQRTRAFARFQSQATAINSSDVCHREDY